MTWKTLLVFVVLCGVSSTAYAAGGFAICANIKNYQAFESAKAFRGKCTNAGVDLPLLDMEKWFRTHLTKKEASPSYCRRTCAVLAATNGTSMGDCVKNTHVASFIKGMLGSITLNRKNCKIIKSQF